MKNRRDKLGHRARSSDASTFDEVCVYCGRTDAAPGKGPIDREPCDASEEYKAAVDAGMERGK